MTTPPIPDSTPRPDLASALWRIYNRPDPPPLWQDGGNLPWNEAGFSARMLKEHLDETHGAASRTTAERAAQLEWLWAKLGLTPGSRVLDLTCGPGLYAVALAERGCHVTGIDFGPAAIEYARQLALAAGMSGRTHFIEQDVRSYDPPPGEFDAAILLYGQLAVFPRDDAGALLRKTAAALRPGGRLLVELLDQDQVDKESSNWWFTDDKGLWGKRPFLHLGERHWIAAEQTSVERYYILDLTTAALNEISLCDQTYAVADMSSMLRAAGFRHVMARTAWDDLPLYDAAEWVVYIAER